MKASDWDLIAKDYYKEVISPLKDCITNPLFSELDFNNWQDKVVLDAGCGAGRLLPTLAKKFHYVYGKDFSKEMINESKKATKGLNNVTCFVGDLKKSYNEKNKYDVLISVNSILDPSVLNITKILKVFSSSLKKGGVFLGVLPSMESYLYQSMLYVDKKTSLKNKESVIERKMKKELNDCDFDYSLGRINFDGLKQKAFYDFEIKYRFKKEGFVNLKLGKVFYDWKEWREAGQAYFPKEEPPWDWYVRCEKPL